MAGERSVPLPTSGSAALRTQVEGFNPASPDSAHFSRHELRQALREGASPPPLHVEHASIIVPVVFYSLGFQCSGFYVLHVLGMLF